MNFRGIALPWKRRNLGSPARFPLGGPGDPLYTMLPAHLEAVSVHSVVGSVDRYAELDNRFRPGSKASPRLAAIRKAMLAGASFPPIDVYRLDGACYVIDGHHRVAAAKEIGQIYLDALVIECRPLTGEGENPLEAARVDFALRTGLRSLAFSSPAGYAQALAQIHEHRWYLCERGRMYSLQNAAEHWFQSIYMPVLRDIAAERLSPLQESSEAGDLYLHLSDLKYQVSRERGHDIGFTAAIRVLTARRRQNSSGTLVGRLLGLAIVTR
jgi:hypothetical protein